jgi:hypothetical protein
MKVDEKTKFIIIFDRSNINININVLKVCPAIPFAAFPFEVFPPVRRSLRRHPNSA